MSAAQDIATSVSIAAIAIDNNIDPDLLNAYADNEGIEDADDALERFQDDYQGTFDNLEDWATELLDSTGELECIPERLRYYFDYEAYARDCELGGDIYTLRTNEGLAVFWNR